MKAQFIFRFEDADAALHFVKTHTLSDEAVVDGRTMTIPKLVVMRRKRKDALGQMAAAFNAGYVFGRRGKS